MAPKKDSRVAIVAAVILVSIFGFVYYTTRQPQPYQLTEQEIAAIPTPKAISYWTPTPGTSKGYTSASTPAPTAKPETDNPITHSDLYIEDLKNAPIEYQLTFLDTRESVRGNDVHAARIRYLLGFISQRTGDGKDHVADQTRRCTIVLRQRYGKSVTNLQFLEEMNSYFLAGGPKDKYDDLSMMMVMTLGK